MIGLLDNWLIKNMIRDFKNLEIWRLAHSLTLDIYKVTKDFPKEEKYGIISQMRRASSSIPANIAEGCWKYTSEDFIHYLHNARGSLSEIMYFLILAKDLNYLDVNTFQELTDSYIILGRQLNAFITSIRK